MGDAAQAGTPSPTELLNEVRKQPVARTYAFEDYLESVHELKSKGHSYAAIASFLGKRLGIAVSRGQVYRAYQLWLARRRTRAARQASRARPVPSPRDERIESGELPVEML